jgi:putative spermidine/putrescine transport system ATP-binding protein
VLLLRTLADERNLTTVLVTHDRDEALALATDLVVLHEGRLVEQGPALRLLQQPACAFTAAFLQGAACLPTTPLAGGAVDTPFGPMPRPAGLDDRNCDLRLVLLPGDTGAVAADGPAGPGRSHPVDRARRSRPPVADRARGADRARRGGTVAGCRPAGTTLAEAARPPAALAADRDCSPCLIP